MTTHYIILAELVWVFLLPCSGIAQSKSVADTTNKQTGFSGDRRGKYQVVLSAGGGTALYQNFVGIPTQWQHTTITRRGNSYTMRAMWYPDHRLRTGIETGLTTFYTYRGTVNGESSSVQVSAIPLMLVFSMPLGWDNGRLQRFWERVSLTAGTGSYLIRSQLAYKGLTSSQELSLGWMAAGSYVQPLGDRFGLVVEVRWLNASTTKESDYALQLHLQWRAFRW